MIIYFSTSQWIVHPVCYFAGRTRCSVDFSTGDSLLGDWHEWSLNSGYMWSASWLQNFISSNLD